MNPVTEPEATSALPGFLAFVAFALLALALWFLMRNMNARMRRMSYRQQAAHRGKDDAQAGPDDAPADGSGEVDGPEASEGPATPGSTAEPARDEEDGGRPTA